MHRQRTGSRLVARPTLLSAGNAAPAQLRGCRFVQTYMRDTARRILARYFFKCQMATISTADIILRLPRVTDKEPRRDPREQTAQPPRLVRCSLKNAISHKIRIFLLIDACGECCTRLVCDTAAAMVSTHHRHTFSSMPQLKATVVSCRDTFYWHY